MGGSRRRLQHVSIPPIPSQPILSHLNLGYYRGSGPGAYGSYKPVTSVSRRRPRTQRGVASFGNVGFGVSELPERRCLPRSVLRHTDGSITLRGAVARSSRAASPLSRTHPPHPRETSAQGALIRGPCSSRSLHRDQRAISSAPQRNNGHSARKLRSHHRACVCTMHLYQRTQLAQA